MKKKKTNVQIIILFTIIIAGFVGSAFFFSYLNTTAMMDSVERETKMSSFLLSSEILSKLSVEEAGELSSDTLQRIFEGDQELKNAISLAREELGEDIQLDIIKKDGTVLYQSTGYNQQKAGNDSPGEKWNDLQISSAGDENESIIWIGRNNPFRLNQSLRVIRELYPNRIYMVLTNHCTAVNALQRRQFALFAGIELALMFVMVVLVSNTVFKYRRQILTLATTDELTGLANRKSFTLDFDEYVKKGEKEFSLFLLDIDFFKQINDTYGHASGDLALQLLASSIKEMNDKYGGFSGRWGGDEFIGILPLPGEDARNVLKGLCDQVSSHVVEDKFKVTISAGVTPSNGETRLNRLSEWADTALYASKEGGRNQASLYTGGIKPDLFVASSVIDTKEKRNNSQEVISDRKNTGGETEKPVMADTDQKANQSDSESNTIGKRFKGYVREKLLSSTLFGVKWMAPFVAGGGILIGLAFLFDAASVDLMSLTVADRSNFGSITQLAATLKNIGGITFDFMLPVFAGFMAYGIAGESAFMAGFVGGYMTIQSQSGFIGAMIAGFAAGVIVMEMTQFFDRSPKFIQAIAPIVIYPIFNLLLMQAITWVIIMPISSFIGGIFTTLLDHAVSAGNTIAGALSAGMMSVDMGGIVNKVAYNYGVRGLETGGTGLMACVMAGGMVPPIGIFLSMVLFRRKYSSEEWERGPSTLFMGLSFITEGALPFVFTDVLRVIPSCIIGSAFAGFLSALFGCQLPAPHGGIFVLPVMGNWLGYIVALTAGSLLTALILGKWKRERI